MPIGHVCRVNGLPDDFGPLLFKRVDQRYVDRRVARKQVIDGGRRATQLGRQDIVIDSVDGMVIEVCDGGTADGFKSFGASALFGLKATARRADAMASVWRLSTNCRIARTVSARAFRGSS